METIIYRNLEEHPWMQELHASRAYEQHSRHA